MAKGWKHASDRRERLLGTYGYRQGHVSGSDLPDLGEEDVWSVAAPADETFDRSDLDRSGQIWLSQLDREVSGLSRALEEACQPRLWRSNRAAAGYAPVTVPVRPRILRVDLVEPIQGSGEVEGDDREWVPPHEFVAREHGRKLATSVFEGVGRTLKGRDMSRVRDAVWSQTGFFG